MGLVTGSNRLAPSISPGTSSKKKRYNGKPPYVTCCTEPPKGMSVRVTVPSKRGLIPGPAIGAPAVSSAGHKTVSHGASVGFGLSLHAYGADVSAWSSSDVTT